MAGTMDLAGNLRGKCRKHGTICSNFKGKPNSHTCLCGCPAFEHASYAIFYIILYNSHKLYGIVCVVTVSDIASCSHIHDVYLSSLLGAVHMSRASPANRADLSHENLCLSTT